MLRRRRLRRTRSGTIKVDLPQPERDLLRHLLPQLRDLLESGSDDGRIRRLFPAAYHDDPEADAEYQTYMRTELQASRLAALETVERSLSASQLTEEEALAWMHSINSVRLVLGTMLDITEDFEIDDLDEDDPTIEHHVLYTYLTALLDELVQVMTP